MNAKSSSTPPAAQPPKSRKAPKPVAWRSMSAAERRVAVAKDVLLLLRRKDKPLKITEGLYVSNLPPSRKYREDTWELISIDRRPLHEILETEVFPKNCEVCARGAAFISCVRLFNEVTVEEAASRKDAVTLTAKLFGEAQVTLIEAAFEGWCLDGDDRPMDFHEAHPDPASRLQAIMESIIANGGTFKP
jgi:hypothetical protein